MTCRFNCRGSPDTHALLEHQSWPETQAFANGTSPISTILFVQACHCLSIILQWAAGLTEGEKEEGAKAKQRLKEEQGGDGEDPIDSDEDTGNHKASGQFKNHLKKNEVCSWHHPPG